MVNSTENYHKHNLSSSLGGEFPTIPVNLDLNASEISECLLYFRFDGLELYIQADTAMPDAASYKLNLYTSESPIEFEVPNSDMSIDVIFTIDLVLMADAQIDVSSGFHILLDRASIDIPLFSSDITDATIVS